MFKYIKTNIAVAILVLFALSPAYAAPQKFENITILVSSCDKYSIFWPPFFTSLFKQWPSLLNENNNLPIVLVANNKSYADPRVQTINIPNEISWADNILWALEHVNTKYVLIALDDYWVSNPVDEVRLMTLYSAMQRADAAMLQISANDSRYQQGRPHATVPNLIYTDKFAQYKASLQMAIWDKEALKVILKPNEDPWTFELAGTIRSHGYPREFLSLTGNEPVRYINASYQGHINPLAMDYAQRNNLSFNYGDFPVLSEYNVKLHWNRIKQRAEKLYGFLSEPGKFYKF